MIAYKGFHPGLVCRDYQFQMGLNVTAEANCAENGFHCAENPLDCLNYYSDIRQSEYYLVVPAVILTRMPLTQKSPARN